jgi:hypothetical protein
VEGVGDEVDRAAVATAADEVGDMVEAAGAIANICILGFSKRGAIGSVFLDELRITQERFASSMSFFSMRFPILPRVRAYIQTSEAKPPELP